mgnify:CR=1 FL=1
MTQKPSWFTLNGTGWGLVALATLVLGWGLGRAGMPWATAFVVAFVIVLVGIFWLARRNRRREAKQSTGRVRR